MDGPIKPKEETKKYLDDAKGTMGDIAESLLESSPRVDLIHGHAPAKINSVARSARVAPLDRVNKRVSPSKADMPDAEKDEKQASAGVGTTAGMGRHMRAAAALNHTENANNNNNTVSSTASNSHAPSSSTATGGSVAVARGKVRATAGRKHTAATSISESMIEETEAKKEDGVWTNEMDARYSTVHTKTIFLSFHKIIDYSHLS